LVSGTVLQRRFGFDAIERIHSEIPTISGTEVALRWIAYHSELSEKNVDEIILGIERTAA